MSDYNIPLVGVISSILTLITAYFTKFKKDDAKLQVLEVKLEACQSQVAAVVVSVETNDRQIDAVEASQTKAAIKTYATMHTTLTAALEKKVDKELLAAQIKHILSDIERLMRKHDD